MGPPERREREKQQVRLKILDAARELFAEHGYDAVTMRKIADKIEYSPTTIYLHFKDKDDLIRELCSHDFLAFSERFAGIGAITDPLKRFRAAGQAYVDFAVEYPNHYRLMFMTQQPTDPSPEALARRGDPQKDAYALLRFLIEDGVERGLSRPELQDVELVSQTVWAALHGVVSLEIALKRNRDHWIDWAPLKKRVSLMMDLMLRALLR